MDACLRLLNDWQHGFPLCPSPFAALARDTGLTEEAVLRALREARDDGRLSRIGGVFAHGAGGDAVLVAMAVPAHRIDTVAEQVSAHPGVNHNYLREHHHNLWFVMTGADRDAVEAGVSALETATGLSALRLRLEKAYRIDLGFDLGGDTARRPMRRSTPLTSERPLLADELPLAQRVEEGLPLVAQPYGALARELGQSETSVTGRIAEWLAEGRLKRFGVVVRHHELGFDANAMTVFNVPDDRVDACGQWLAEQAGVTLAYRRSRAEGWPFNLYAMVHGTHRDAVLAVIERVTQAAGLSAVPREVLFSTRRFKQTGARRFRGWATATGHSPAVTPMQESEHAIAR
ncbi:siroheme decarboxylase subunit beta [Hydrogenophaga sp. MI9]|uniref:siroheme decarboxylase subunit beta n=1 Tax=Hydrogenophaga sp. MI9 TaxID=3453719 RepID=UPI003EEB1FA3